MSAKILKGGTVLTFDGTALSIKVLPEASVLIINDRITAIEEDFDNLPSTPNADVIDVKGKIVSPGFVNTHVHVWQTAYRSIAPDVNLVHYFDWLSHMSKTATTTFTPNDIYISSLEGYLEGLNGGVTSYVDHAHNNWAPEIMESGFDAAVDSGARVWWCYDVTARYGFPVNHQWEALAKISERPSPETVEIGLGYDGFAGAADDAIDLVKKKVK